MDCIKNLDLKFNFVPSQVFYKLMFQKIKLELDINLFVTLWKTLRFPYCNWNKVVTSINGINHILIYFDIIHSTTGCGSKHIKYRTNFIETFSLVYVLANLQMKKKKRAGSLHICVIQFVCHYVWSRKLVIFLHDAIVKHCCWSCCGKIRKVDWKSVVQQGKFVFPSAINIFIPCT